jgi:hypothetical protein
MEQIPGRRSKGYAERVVMGRHEREVVMSGRDRIVVYGACAVLFVVGSGVSRAWAAKDAARGADPATSCQIEEFQSSGFKNGTMGSLGWTKKGSGPGGGGGDLPAGYSVQSEPNHPGIWSVGDDFFQFELGYADGPPHGNTTLSDDFDMTWILRFTGLPGIDSLRVGFMTAVYEGSNPEEGAYFELNPDGTWHTVTRFPAGSEDRATTVAFETNTWYNLRIRRRGAAVQFSIDDIRRTSHKSTIPTISLNLKVAAGGTSVENDYVSLCYANLSR